MLVSQSNTWTAPCLALASALTLITACGGGSSEGGMFSAEHGSAEQGSAETGGAEQGSAEQGSAEQGDGDPGDGDGDGDADDGSEGSNTKWDTLAQGDHSGGGGGGCNGMGSICDGFEFSYIWIANSGENTVTKLNTRTMEEEGRYWTRPDQGGSPSRTSVSVDGRAVAIANRHVGITKIWADLADCEDTNQNGMIDTSTGKLDVRPFAEDECIAWHQSWEDMSVQRPVAWTSGEYNESTCMWENQKIWTTTGSAGNSPGQCGTTGVWVHRLDGDTGEVEDTIHIPHEIAPCTIGNIEWGLGPYGAAVDNDNNLWFYIWSQSKVVRVDYDTLEYEVHPGGSYGITVDSEGRPWSDIPRRLNLDTLQWDSAIGNLPGSGGTGVAEDLQGRIWSGTSGGVGWVDMETMQVGDTVLLPDALNYRGIAVDVDGFIWAIGLGGTKAYKIDPDTYEIDWYDGLNSPYTYSDMAGGQLANVTCNEPQG